MWAVSSRRSYFPVDQRFGRVIYQAELRFLFTALFRNAETLREDGVTPIKLRHGYRFREPSIGGVPRSRGPSAFF